jgi:(p)ppGpp synthase/HD superfamily hydrolase
LARGSGKPFIAHLVGTASLVMESGCPDDWVIGALLHAPYQHRVPFESGLAPEERRTVLADRFGTQVAELVRRYTSFASEGLAAFMGTGQR